MKLKISQILIVVRLTKMFQFGNKNEEIFEVHLIFNSARDCYPRY